MSNRAHGSDHSSKGDEFNLERIPPKRRAPFGDNPRVGKRGRETRRLFLRAALEAFRESGLRGASIESITGRVGASRATFYQYFDSKDDIYRHLAARFGTEMSSLLRNLATIDGTRTGRNLIRGWLTDLTTIYDRYQPIADSWEDAARRIPQMAEASLATGDRFMTDLSESLAIPDASPVPPEALANLAAQVAYGACFYRSQYMPIPVDRLVDALADAIHRAIFGPIKGVNLGPAIERSTLRGGGCPTFEAPDLSGLRHKGRLTRQRMLEAAVEAFERLGYDDTRVEDIVIGAGLSRGTFYRYFDDKRHAFAELANSATASMVDLLSLLPHPEGGISSWATRYVTEFDRHRSIFSVWQAAGAAGDPSGAAMAAALMGTWADILETRGFGDVDADLPTFFSLVARFPGDRNTRSRFSSEETAAALALFMSRGLLGRETVD